MTRARDLANLIGSGNYSSTTFTATAGQTAFTISHTQGFIQVFMNGLLLDETVDYTSNGSAVTLTSGAAAGDEIEVVAYNTFSVGDALPKSGGAMTGDLTVDTNTFHVDVADNRVGVGTTSPDRLFSVSSSTTRTSGFEDIAEYVTPSIGVGGSTSLNVGRANSNYDLGKMAFKYNGAGSTSNQLGFGFYGADNLLKIDGAGRVTKPYQPSFWAYMSQSNPNVTTSNIKIPYSATRWNVGSHFDTTNSRFVAPIAGKYCFQVNHNVYGLSDDQWFRTRVYVNGSSYQILGYMRARGSGDHTTNDSFLLDMSANDYVEIYSNSPDTSYYLSAAIGWNSFSGFLIG